MQTERFTEVEAADGQRFPLLGFPRPENDSPVVLIAPAMGTPAGFYRRFLYELHGAGATALVLDHRGSGDRSQAPRDTAYHHLVGDIGAAIGAIRTSRPEASVTVCGHSLGGQLALVQAALAGERAEPAPDAVAIVAAGSVHHRAYGSRSLGLLAATQSAGLIATVLGHWPGHRLGFGGRQPTGVIRDWAHQARTGRYRVNGTDTEAALQRLRLPLLAVDVEGDHMAPPGAVTHLCDKAPHARLERRAYTRAEAGEPVDHFRWARHGGPLARDLVQWARASRDEA
ncbi:alpha/beta fold hydrolase [Streptomyces sp. NPDC001941]|uniref:alpha/beta hydrolase family protein n=1 Tax=Streptomyces sp. NPDC001941 TaxID=3154659 RepID=UPI0033192FD3